MMPNKDLSQRNYAKAEVTSQVAAFDFMHKFFDKE
jgi:hypothetical protein